MQKWDFIRKKRGEMQQNLDSIISGNRRGYYWTKIVRVLKALSTIWDVHQKAVAICKEENLKLDLALKLQSSFRVWYTRQGGLAAICKN
jgi:hypothetical protein